MARKHLDAVRRAVSRRAAADTHLEDALLAAKESGETTRDIQAAAGMGRTKVYQLIGRAKARRR